jgi:xanthine dehydrogenase accessory factor
MALSVLAAVVGAVRLDGLTAPAGSGPAADPAPRTARDPACGMTVTVGPDTPTAVVDGVEEAFCGSGCRDGYLARTP